MQMDGYSTIHHNVEYDYAGIGPHTNDLKGDQRMNRASLPALSKQAKEVRIKLLFPSNKCHLFFRIYEMGLVILVYFNIVVCGS